MSGIASAASAMPGSVATFTSCSSDRSSRIAPSSSASARMRAGTRMSLRAEAGISQVTSSTWRGSKLDIEHDPGAISVLRRLELQPVVGHRLDEVRGISARDLHLRAREALVQLDPPKPDRDERLRLRKEDELLDERREQRRAVGCLRRDDPARCRSGGCPARAEQLTQRGRGLREHLLGALALDLELELARVLDPAVHA